MKIFTVISVTPDTIDIVGTRSDRVAAMELVQPLVDERGLEEDDGTGDRSNADASWFDDEGSGVMLYVTDLDGEDR